MKKHRTLHPEIVRPPVPGLEPGKFYRRTVPYGEDSDIPGYMPEDGFPVCRFVYGIAEGKPGAGQGGWFIEDKFGGGGGKGLWRFYLAAHVEEVGGSKGMTATEENAASCCVEDCETTKYSQRLCSKHYGRARKLVKGEGLDWDQAREQVTP